jgi:hypothetical protein
MCVYVYVCVCARRVFYYLLVGEDYRVAAFITCVRVFEWCMCVCMCVCEHMCAACVYVCVYAAFVYVCVCGCVYVYAHAAHTRVCARCRVSYARRKHSASGVCDCGERSCGVHGCVVCVRCLRTP